MATKSGFRETMWFKLGAARSEEPAELESPADDDAAASNLLLPIEDRYADDGSVTAADREAFGMHTGTTEYLQILPDAPAAPASDELLGSLIGEMKQVNRKIFAVVGAGVVSAGALLLLYVM